MRTKMWKYYLKFIFISSLFTVSYQKIQNNLIHLVRQQNVISTKNYVFWPNATVPFYVNPEHFDDEQTLGILRALSRFAFGTCVKFAPVMTAPNANEHVLVFENERGVRRCTFDTEPHSVFEPHRVTLGYKCLVSPHIEAVLMRALGFPFEHNTVNRDFYIEVLLENVEPGARDLFTRDATQPAELRLLPYDVNSVTHFGSREYSANGHRTILFKDPNTKQNRIGLTKTDHRKIEIVYGPECRARDRQEKIDLCQSYPGVARRKRDIYINEHSTAKEQPRRKRDVKSSGKPELGRKKRDLDEVTQSLRINPDITAPPNTSVANTLKELGIQNAVQEIVDQVNKVSALALKNARDKYCNNTKPTLRSRYEGKTDSDILGIIELIADYAQGMVDNAVANLTKFCEESQSIEVYQRARCSWSDGSERCRQTYRSTKSGLVRHSTQHRPIYIQSTKHPKIKHNIYVPLYRAGNDTDVTEAARRKREAGDAKENSEGNNKKEDVENDKQEVEKATDLVKKVTDSDKENNQDKAKDNEKAEDTNEKTEENANEEGKALRSGTIIPGMKVNRYKPMRRSHSGRDRARLEDSSVSMETVRPRKRKRLTETTEDGSVTRQMKRDRMRYVAENGEGEINRNKMKKPRGDQMYSWKVVELTKENEEFYKERRWPGGVVRYIIQEDKEYDTDDLRRRLDKVNSILKRKTCVRLKEITEEQAKNYDDYLVIDTSPDYVTGRVGGRQRFGSVELYRGKQHRQHTAMMVMAMLGFYFEAARHDRDNYIRVHLRHVRPEKLHHFEKIPSDATLPLPFDYASATHPAWQYWRQLAATGISTVATYKHMDPDGSVMRSLGQNTRLLSDIDIVKINSVYGVKCFRNERRNSSTN